MIELASLNFLAIGVAAVSSFFLGGLWYSPPLFGTTWMQLTGMTEERAQARNPLKLFGSAFLASLIMAFALAVLLSKINNFAEGISLGIFAGLGVVAMGFAINDLFEQRSFKLYAINAAYQALSVILMSAILAAWR